MKPDESAERKRSLNKLWVPVVLLTGTILGVFSYGLTQPEYRSFPRFVGPGGVIIGGPSPMSETVREFHAVESTIEVSLLVALIVVYARTYTQTKANFVLGILTVLFALLFQSVLTHPLSYDAIERSPFQAGVSSPVADAFTIVAYAVFLFLSLE